MSFTILSTSLQSLVMLAVFIASFSRSELPSDAAPYSNGLVHLLKQNNVKVHNININYLVTLIPRNLTDLNRIVKNVGNKRFATKKMHPEQKSNFRLE